VTAGALTVVAVIALCGLYARDARRQRRQRAALFSQCLDLFQSYRVTQRGNDFPTLEGRYRGLEVRLEPVLDTVAWRKLPSLWLKATLLVPNAVTGVLDLLVRPQGVEFFSPAAELAYRVPVPESWPQHAILCTDDIAAMPQLRTLEAYATLFCDPRMKELLITPRGTRLVRQLWQAERAEYLVLRQAKFLSTCAEPQVVESLLEALIGISARLNGSASATTARAA
jgi:hypothetical protein